MASKINAVISELIKETMHTTIDNLVDFLNERVELDVEIKEIFEEYRRNIHVPDKITAKKRNHVPSAYNIYIKDKISELKAAGHKGNMMKLAVEAWKQEKNINK